MRKTIFSSHRFIFLTLLIFFLSAGLWCFSHGFINTTSVKWMGDATLLATTPELGGMRFFVVYPPLPIYGLSFLSFLPIIPSFFTPILLSTLLVTWMFIHFYKSLCHARVQLLIVFSLLLLFCLNPLVFFSSIQGGESAIAIISSYFLSCFLIQLVKRLTLQPLVNIAFFLVFFFLSDVFFASYLLAILIVLVVLLDHASFSHDYPSLWFILLFPLFTVTLTFLVGSFYVGGRFPGFFYIFEPHIPTQSIVVHSLISLKTSLFFLIKGLLLFPVLVLAILLAWKKKEQRLCFIAIVGLPALAILIALLFGFEHHESLCYFVGPALVSTLYIAKNHKDRVLILFIVLFVSIPISAYHMIQTQPSWVNSLKGQTLINPYEDEFKIVSLLKENNATKILADYRTAFPMIAIYESARPFILPHMERFDAELLKDIDAQYIVVPSKAHPLAERDRVLSKLLSPLNKDDVKKYDVIYTSLHWEVLKLRNNGEIE